jgi:hypothetical protein
MCELPFNQLDDDSFELALYEMTNGRVNLDEDRLAYLKFNPLSFYNFDIILYIATEMIDLEAV